MRKLFCVFTLVGMGLVPLGTLAANEHCDRGCLQELTAQYVNAVVSNNVDAVPTMPLYGGQCKTE